MLPVKDQTRSLKLQLRPWIQAACCPLDVQNRYPWIIEDRPPGLLDPKCPIDVFSVHPECFVEQSDLLDSFSPHHHERAHDAIDFGLNVLGQIGHVVAPE